MMGLEGSVICVVVIFLALVGVGAVWWLLGPVGFVGEDPLPVVVVRGEVVFVLVECRGWFSPVKGGSAVCRAYFLPCLLVSGVF